MQRAKEGERPDALFYDPFARQLAGAHGQELCNALPRARVYAWLTVVRTQIMDNLILDALENDGYDTVLNLAAGLDTRPYRLALPAALRWIEVDVPEIIEYKNTELREARTFCRLERHPVDLTDRVGRNTLFARVSAAADRVLVITEEVLIDLTVDRVMTLATDLHQQAPFHCWLTDLASPSELRMRQRHFGKRYGANGARLNFAPAEPMEFFRPLHWKPVGFHCTWDEAKRFNRRETSLAALVTMPSALMPGSGAARCRLGGIVALARA